MPPIILKLGLWVIIILLVSIHYLPNTLVFEILLIRQESTCQFVTFCFRNANVNLGKLGRATVMCHLGIACVTFISIAAEGKAVPCYLPRYAPP